MTTVSPPQSQQQQQQMPAPTLDKDYDYQQPSATSTSHPRVKKGLGAMPMQAVEDNHSSYPAGQQYLQQQQRVVSPVQRQDPPAASEQQQQETSEGDEALLDLEQLEELHHEAERMKALGNKHMAAQVRTAVGDGCRDF
jgi:hypothetical protein